MEKNMKNIKQENVSNAESATRYSRRDALRLGGRAFTAAALGIPLAGEAVLANAPNAAPNIEFVANGYRLINYSTPLFAYDAMILLYDAEGKYDCNVYFMKNGRAIPANTTTTGTNIHAYFPLSRLDEFVSTLRNEGKVNVIFVPSNGIFSISSNEEPLT